MHDVKIREDKLDELRAKQQGERESFTAYILDANDGTYETRKVPIDTDTFKHDGQTYTVQKKAIYAHKSNPIKVFFKWILSPILPKNDGMDTSDKITSHMLDPSRRVNEEKTGSCDVIEYEEGIYDIDSVFTGPEGDMVLHNRGDAIPKPEIDEGDYGKYDDPSVALKERQFNEGILKKISQMPSGGLGIDFGSLPPWAIMLLFIIVIMLLGGM